MFCIGILLGSLFLLELSNAVLILVTFLLFVVCKVKVSLKKLGILFLGFGIGVLPFLLYDLTNKFYQLGGFSLWVANRTRLFLGLTLAEDGTSTYAGSALILIWEQFVRFIFPASPLFVIILAIVGLMLFLASVKRVFKEN